MLLAFSYDGADEHAILVMIDRAIDGGLFRELTLSMQVDSMLDILHRADDGLVSEPLDPAYARRLLEDAVSTTDELIDSPQYQPRPVPAAYRKMRALTMARARALSDVAAPPDPLPSSVEIELLKRSFLASDAASVLPANDATSQALDLLVAHFTHQAACHPLHLGPRRILAVLGLPTLAPDQIDVPDVGQILPDVAQSWVTWTAAERGLPSGAAERLRQAVQQARPPLRFGSGEGHDRT